jgi:hypothetical protein
MGALSADSENKTIEVGIRRIGTQLANGQS